MNRIVTQALDVPSTGTRTMKRGLRLAVRGFLALAALLTVTISATSATMLYNSAVALRDEAEAAAVHLAELLSASFADIGEISLANVARTLDATLDDQMIAQARIAAHMVAAAEAAGQDPPRIIETLDAIVADTVLDEFWITDSVGFSYLTNVRDGNGELVPFRFDPDPAVQPQAHRFFELLGSDVDDDTGVITQPAQVREIDQEVYKYVGVGGVDQERIVQIGNALVFGEQEILTNTFTSERADVSAVVEGIIGQHMLVQAHMAGHFVAAAEEAGWSPEEIEGRLRRITGATVIGEIRVVDADGSVAYSSLLPPLAGGSGAAVPYLDEIAPLLAGSEPSLEFATAPRASTPRSTSTSRSPAPARRGSCRSAFRLRAARATCSIRSTSARRTCWSGRAISRRSGSSIATASWPRRRRAPGRPGRGRWRRPASSRVGRKPSCPWPWNRNGWSARPA